MVRSMACADDTGFRLYAIGSSASVVLDVMGEGFNYIMYMMTI